MLHDSEEFLQRNTCLHFSVQQAHLTWWWAARHCSLGLQWPIAQPTVRHLWNTGRGVKRLLTTKKLEGVCSAAHLHNHPVLVPSRHPQRGLSAPPLLGIILIRHMLFSQQFYILPAVTLFCNDEMIKACWQRNEHRNLMLPNWEQQDTIKAVHFSQIFLRWTRLSQCLLKRSAMCG